MLSDQAAERLNEMISNQRDRHGSLYIGNGAEFLTAENVAEIPDPGKDTELELG